MDRRRRDRGSDYQKKRPEIARSKGAWILTVALTASMLGGCGGGGNSSSASSSTGTAAVEASTADTAASAATEEKTVSADAASTETTDAADAASTEASGENGEVSVAGRYDVARYNYGVEAEHNDEWMELNADGTGTLCLGEEPFAITYERDESAFNMEGILDYSLIAEDGTEYSGAVHVDKDVFNVADNDFNLVMMVKEGTKAYDQFYLGLEVAPDESTVTGHFDGIDAETQEANGDWLELEEGGKGTHYQQQGTEEGTPETAGSDGSRAWSPNGQRRVHRGYEQGRGDGGRQEDAPAHADL